jgi:DNA polymerase-3 subunit delta'
MNLFDKIIGHKAVLAHLKRILNSETRPHALLFTGPSGVGKKLAAIAMAQGLLCQNKVKPCGKCSSCLRLSKMQHPDLLLTGPQDAATIKIEQIREIQNFVSLKSYEGRGKVIVIDEVQAMTAQGANALLKTLEEPPENCYFILLTGNKSGVLGTIQSRCQKILFGSLTPQDLKALFPQMEEWVFELAQGRADAAVKYSDEVYKKLRGSSLRVLKDIPYVRAFEGFSSIEPLVEDRETASFAIQCWAQWVKSATALKLGAKALLMPDERGVIEDFSKQFTSPQLLKLGQKIMRLEQDIQANINKNLAFEKFWIDASSMKHAGENR